MWALLSLAVGSFGIGMTEFVTMGLLPRMAEDLLPAQYASSAEGAIGQAGILISLYALGVVLGAPTIAALVSRFPRRTVILALVAALLVFNALTLVMPTFGLVGLTRFLAGLPHGAFFGMAALAAAELYGPERRGRAIAIVMSGLMVANLVGVPAGTLLGQRLGWQAAYGVVVVVFALAFVFIRIFVPQQQGDASSTLRRELGIFRLPQVWFTVGVAGIGFGAFFAVYSYVATLVTDASGADEWVVPIALIAVGAGMVVGNIVGGALADRSVRATLLYGLGAICATALLVGALSGSTVWLIGALFLFALVSTTAMPALQLRLFDVGRNHLAIASALNHSAMNMGNSLGAALGGAAIAAGWGYVAPAWVAAALAFVGIGIALWAFAAERRDVARTIVTMEREFDPDRAGTDTIPTV